MKKLAEKVLIAVSVAAALLEVTRFMPLNNPDDNSNRELTLSIIESKVSIDRSPRSYSRNKRLKEILEDYKKGKKIISDNRNEELLINLSLYKQQIGSNSSNEQTKLSLKSAYLGKIKSINDEYESRLITLKDKMSYDFRIVSKNE